MHLPNSGIHLIFVTFNHLDYAISNTMDDAMTAKGDLRLLKYADPCPDAQKPQVQQDIEVDI